VVAIALTACGGTTTSPPATTSGNTTADAAATDNGSTDTATADVARAPEDTGPPAGPVAQDPLTVPINVLNSKNEMQQASLAGVVLVPAKCKPDKPEDKCPLVVVVGDYDSDAYPAYEQPAMKMAAALPAVVVVFNLPGLGKGSKKSEGEDDIGGDWHEAAVKQVMFLLSTRKYVDPARTGYLTIGTGLIPVARAIKAFGPTTLKNVQFLIDVEGPSDRCAISQAPQDDGKGVGPGDGEGATDTACNFGSGGATHSAMYPAAKDGNPASIVCAQGAWPITQTGKTCKENDWWLKREPANALKGSGLPFRYQRIQFKHDHRLASYWASRILYKAVVASKSPWHTINDFQPCQNPPTDADCVGQPCWLEGDWGTGLAPAPYAGGKLKPLSLDALFTKVLPGYVQRVTDAKKFPNCK
jgi:hypothetical protein